MKLQIWSKSKIGKWANSLTLIFFVLIALKLINLQAIRLPIPTPIIVVLGFVGFLMGLISIIKEKDKAVFTILSILVGLLILIWIVLRFILIN